MLHRTLRVPCTPARGGLAARASRRWLFSPPDLQRVISTALEAAAEHGQQAVNTTLAAAGSPLKFKKTGAGSGSETAAAGGRGESDPCQPRQQQREHSSLFWAPYSPDSPFSMGREAFIAKHLAKATSSGSLVPDHDVEQYVDLLLSEAVLSNASLPPSVGRQLYISVVRIVQRVILNAVSLAEGEVLGKQLRLLKQPSEASKFRGSAAAGLDPRVLRLLAARTVNDHIVEGKHVALYLSELGIPLPLVERLYEDIIALSARLVLDVSLTFQIRCLGHALTCQITPDEMLHAAQGWEVALEKGAFGLFNDREKRRWARLFVADLLQDDTIRIQQLPESVQSQMYLHVSLVMLNLAETALNHFRIHIAGMAFRPALLETHESRLSVR